jgi:hypothetical protein
LLFIKEGVGLKGGRHMPRGASPKREREYEKLKDKFKKEKRYRGREKEVASRIVNEQRDQYGETREEKRKDREGKSPDRGLPIKDYQHLTARQVSGKLNALSKPQLKKIRSYEEKHKNRRIVIQDVDRKLKSRK